MAGKWTKAQQQAIQSRKGPVLVSAAAGSGKTSVLVERAIGLICDENHPIDADRLLIVTYTNAAAAEMKQRIGARLAQLARETPGNLRLISQQAALSRASIGTIHSFCLGLIRENFQHLPISHDFSVADEGELELMRQESARTALEQFYLQDEDGSFQELVELLSGTRDDARLISILLRLYDFARAHPFYLSWLDRVQHLYESSPAIEETHWGRTLLTYAADTLDFCISSMGQMRETLREDEKAEKAYGPAFSSDLVQLEACRIAVREGNWDKAVSSLSGVEYVRLGALRGNDTLKAQAQGVRKRCRKLIERLSNDYLNATGQDFAQDMADLAPKLATLFDLIRTFDRIFTEEKSRKKRLDYADLEHLALSLLAREREDGSCERTPLAVALSQRFEQVLVDEYQDVNEVQELLFTCVSRMQQNLFMVGDAKQGIYSFRLATPAIFLHKKESYAVYQGEGGEFPAKIILDMNFRSRREVTQGVNFLFSLLMSRRLGDIAYQGEERLVCGATYPASAGDLRPQLLLLDGTKYAGDEDFPTLEARLVAEQIAQMLAEGYPVSHQGKTRPCCPGDFCILMRSPRRRLQTYFKALEEQGIPVWVQNADGFLSLREVSMVLSLLEALDNPLLDLPLVAALISPLFGFSDDDIAALRLAGKGLPFYLALEKGASGAVEAGLARRCADFLELFSHLRSRAAVLPTDRLLLELYACTDALAIAQVMPLGENRRANLLLLVEYASTYHDLGYKQLGGFVGFITRLRERGGDLAPAGLAGEGGGAVQIMSVHRSKGLEFPIVILADTAKGFNRTDLNQNYQLHSEYGFACARRDPETMRQFSTLPMQAIKLERIRDLLGEELRILYVALTRAKEKLIITGYVGKNLARKLEGLVEEVVDGRLNPRALEEASCPLDWILAALLHHPDGKGLRELAGCSQLLPQEDDNAWQIQIIPAGKQTVSQEKTQPPRLAQPDLDYLSLLQQRAAWRYPYELQTKIPTKLAVSQVSQREEGKMRFRSRPRFLEAKGLTPAERGSALHQFMQFADYHKARVNLEEEIARMARQRYLTASQTESLDRKALAAFFQGPLARRIFAADQVWRELRFLGEYGKDVLGERLEMDDDAKITLQGVADCVFVEKGKAVIVDYKTDRVKTPEELLERYALQLQLYRRILSQALTYPVGECLLYSFALGRAIPVE
ncbi:MAG: helicase-exonuclease AddAB subunit AddA [Oscillospiraceae bacterium]